MTLSPREVALRILAEKGADSRGFSLSLLKDRRDRALAEKLVNGITEWKALLDHYLASFSKRPLSGLSPEVLAALRLGAFQLLMLGTPPHAGVSTVLACLRGRGEKAFVNGVLRALSRQMGHVEIPSLDDDPPVYASVRFSYPLWMSRLFTDRFGMADGLRLCDFGNRPPPLNLRVNRQKTSVQEFSRRLEAVGVASEPGAVPGAVRLLQGVDVTALPGFREGDFLVQDEAAMVVSLVANPEAGETVWDACAAPGGKTAHLAELMEDQGKLIATDIDEGRVDMVRETAARMGFRCVEAFAADAADNSRGLDSRIAALMFDRILLDAPCSGLGVIRRNSDLRWNRRATDVIAMASRQRALLNSVVTRLKPGGVLVYSTCTLTREENEDTWTGFLASAGDMVPEDPMALVDPEVGRLFSAEPFAGPGFRYLLPHRSGTDGFFVARARRLAKGI